MGEQYKLLEDSGDGDVTPVGWVTFDPYRWEYNGGTEAVRTVLETLPEQTDHDPEVVDDDDAPHSIQRVALPEHKYKTVLSSRLRVYGVLFVSEDEL